MRALLSVYDKSGLGELARGLVDLGFELISTGGTLKHLRGLGLDATSVSEVTGFPEILEGRVKTLHPRIHGGILARREIAGHRVELANHDIAGIDLIAGNLYPFEAAVNQPGCTLINALENIDIGGPAMIRAGAKNFPNVIVLTDPADYPDLLAALQSGEVTEVKRRDLAARAFQHVSTYDALVAEYLRGSDARYPGEFTLPGRKVLDLRYGENPHQTAAAYNRPSIRKRELGVLDAVNIQGKELSYNNILDADAALSLARRLDQIGCVIVKHAIPCGAAVRSTAEDAFAAALASDPVSAFGGIVAVNSPVDGETAMRLSAGFFEVIITTEFSTEALSILASKKNLRLLALGTMAWNVQPAQAIRSVIGGFLVQNADTLPDDPDLWTIASKTNPTASQARELAFAWEVCRQVRSNAIVLSKDQAVVGVGPGQPNRVDSVRIAIERAGSRAAGSVLASDAFFPFADGVQVALKAGISAIVQSGGSMRDSEVIAACDEAGVPMLFTGTRHFLH